MEVSLKVQIFLGILDKFEKLIQSKIEKNQYLIPKQKNLNDINPLYKDDLGFDIIKLLKNEYKPYILGQIKEQSELIYLNRQNVSKLEIIQKQKEFYEMFNILNERIQMLIANNNINNSNIDRISISNRINNNIKSLTTKEFLKFYSKSEFEQFLKIILENGPGIRPANATIENFKQLIHTNEKEIFKFFKEFYIVLRNNKEKLLEGKTDIINSIANELEERINLSFYYVRKRNYFEEDFELHKAVYENNLRMIRKICAFETTSHLYCDINEIDSQGNTPLMLAIKLQNYDAINVLCDHEADVKHKSFDGDVSPLEHSLLLKNRKILKILINAVKKQKLTHWENNKSEVLKLIKSIPDFSLELKLNFDSNIFSLFSSITPSDYYKFCKSGGNVRIDMNISAINSSFNSIKGKCSILIKEKGNKISIYKIDHDKKISYDFIDYITNIADEDKKVQQMLDEGLMSSKVYTKDISLKKEKMKKDDKIVNFVSKKHTAKGILYIIKEKYNTKQKKFDEINNQSSFKSLYQTFSDYFKEGVKLRDNFLENNKLLNNTGDANSMNYKSAKFFKEAAKSYNGPEKFKLTVPKYNSTMANSSKNQDEDILKLKTKDKKNKMSSTSKIKNFTRKESNDSGVSNSSKNEIESINLNTHNNMINNRSDSEFEIEYIEKLKKTGNAKIHKKSIEMSVWLSDAFPLRLNHFIPLLHILSFTSNEFSQLKSTLCSNFLPFESFPLKISFPLGMSFYALLQVTSFSQVAPSESVFELNYEKKTQFTSSMDNEEANKDLDDKYAKDFYERYFLEKNLKNRNENSECEQSSSFNEKIRDIFLNDSGDDKMIDYDENKVPNDNFPNTQPNVYPVNNVKTLSYFQTNLNYLDTDFYLENGKPKGNKKSRNKNKNQYENNIENLLNSTNSFDFTDSDDEFNDLEMEILSNGGDEIFNSMDELDLTSIKFKNNLKKKATKLGFEQVKFISSTKKTLSNSINKIQIQNNQIPKESKLFKVPIKSILIKKLLDSSNNVIDNLEKDEVIPMETEKKTHLNLKIPYSPTPRRKDLSFGKSILKETETQFPAPLLNCDGSQKTLKISLNTKKTKNCVKNKSNITKQGNNTDNYFNPINNVDINNNSNKIFKKNTITNIDNNSEILSNKIYKNNHSYYSSSINLNVNNILNENNSKNIIFNDINNKYSTQINNKKNCLIF